MTLPDRQTAPGPLPDATASRYDVGNNKPLRDSDSIEQNDAQKTTDLGAVGSERTVVETLRLPFLEEKLSKTEFLVIRPEQPSTGAEAANKNRDRNPD